MKTSMKTAIVALFAATSLSALAQTGWLQTGAGPYDYNEPTNWVDEAINGTWSGSLTLTDAQTVTFGANTSLETGLIFQYAGGKATTLRSDGTGNRMLTLGGDITHNTPSSGANIILGSVNPDEGLNVNLGGFSRTLSNNRNFTFASAVTGTGGLSKEGTGILYLGGGTTDFATNDYSGITQLKAGPLYGNKANYVVAIPGDAEVQGGGSLMIRGRSGQIAQAATITVTSGSFSVAGTSSQQASHETVSNVYVLGSASSASVGAGSYGGSSVTVLGNTIVSNATLSVVGKSATWNTDRMELWGAPNSTSITVRTTDNNGGATAAIGAGGWTIHQPSDGTLAAARVSCTTSSRTAMLRLDGDLTFNGSASNTNSVLIVEDGSQIRRYVGLSGTRTLTVNPGGSPQELVIQAQIVDSSGTGGIVKEGDGTLVLANICSYTGPTTVNDGRLDINLELTDRTVSVVVNTGGTLGGTGTINRAVSVIGGTLAPGLDPGIPGPLTLGKNLTCDSGGTVLGSLNIELASAIDYGRIVMTSPTAQVNLSDIQLEVSHAGGYRPSANTTFTLVDNQGSTPISGTFEGLPDKGQILLDGRLYSITYSGGDGNDVVLTAREKGSAIIIR